MVFVIYNKYTFEVVFAMLNVSEKLLIQFFFSKYNTLSYDYRIVNISAFLEDRLKINQ